MGRLVRDPEVRYTQTGKVVAQLVVMGSAIALPEGSVKAISPSGIQEKVVTTEGPLHILETKEIKHKGQKVLVEGRLQIRSYDAKDGSKKWITEIIASVFEFCEKKEEASANYPSGTSTSYAGQGSNMESFGSAVPFDEEIPF